VADGTPQAIGLPFGHRAAGGEDDS
jgi:hypothetical protein